MRLWLWSLLGGAALAVLPVRGTLAASAGQSAAPALRPSQPNAVSGAAIVQTALKYLGYRYTTVGNRPQDGFSCIGFVSYVFQSNGIPLPDDLDQAMAYAAPIPFSNLLPGDILFFQNTVWTGLSHTAIYVGGGRFVHAEWYNRGVVVSSFNHDPVDGNYWIAKYLGANRPWGGPPGVAAVPPEVSGVTVSGVAPLAVSGTAGSGTPVVVVVQALNVRAAPSRKSAVQEVIMQGAAVTVVGHRGTWFQVQLADGAVGWVVAEGISHGTTVPPSAPAVTATPIAPVAVGSQGTNAVPPKPQTGMTVLAVPWARVRRGPSLDAAVVTVATRGQRFQILTRQNGWVHVRLEGGTTGWISASLVDAPATSAARPAVRASSPPKTPVTHTAPSASPRPVRAVVVTLAHIHSAPGVSTPVVVTVPAGTHVEVRTRQVGWSLVRLSSGTSGYILSILLH